jgi:prevent-host-death family protein
VWPNLFDGHWSGAMWTVQEAKAKLSEVLKRAKQGEAQVIGVEDPCVVISMGEYRRLSSHDDSVHLGKWLVDNAPRGFELELPSRKDDRPDPFAWLEDDAQAVTRVNSGKAKTHRKRRA